MAIVCFTPQGKELAEELREKLPAFLEDARWEVEFIYRPVPFRQWMQEHFASLDALIFIGAMGIVVRDMAPCLKSKLTDPAVVVLDEKGQFAISVMSGHLGGANQLCRSVAHLIDAVPVITTSSDVNGKIAIDVFANENHLLISSMKQAKLCASAIVSGHPVHFSCEGEVEGRVPPELSAEREVARFHVCVTPYRQPQQENLLWLIPKAFVLGIGCRRGTGGDVIEARVREELERYNIDLRSIASIASIDLKKEEEGLIAFASRKKLPLHFYTGEELKALEGTFSASDFVSEITGVDNVCERAAYRLAQEYGDRNLEECIVIPKTGKNGVTIALMRIEWRVCFE